MDKAKIGCLFLLFTFPLFIGCSDTKKEEDLREAVLKATETGQWNTAAQLSEQLYKRNPDDAEANYEAATNYLRLNYPDKALAILNSFKNSTKKQDTEVGKRDARTAKAYYMTRQYSRVLEVAANYTYPKMYRGLAREHLKALIRLGKFEELSTYLEAYRQSGIFRENGKATNTDFLFKAVLNELILVKNDTLVASYAQRFQQWVSKNQSGSDALRNKSYISFYLKDYELAKMSLQSAIKEEQSLRHLIELEMLLGVCYAKTGDFEKAEMQIRKIHSMDDLPPRHDAFGAKFYNQARIEAAMRRKKAAMQSLKKALENNAAFWSYKFKEDGFLVPLFGWPPFEELVKPKG